MNAPPCPFHRTYCPSCDSPNWSTITNCTVCDQRICDQCEGAERIGARQIVCGKCMRDASEALDAINPEFYETVCDLIEQRDGSIPDQPVSLELFRAIADCETVDQVREAFRKFSPGPKDAQPERGGARKWEAA